MRAYTEGTVETDFRRTGDMDSLELSRDEEEEGDRGDPDICVILVGSSPMRYELTMLDSGLKRTRRSLLLLRGLLEKSDRLSPLLRILMLRRRRTSELK